MQPQDPICSTDMATATMSSAQGSTPLQPQISLHHHYIPSPLPSSPSFNLHLTRLKDTYLLWIGSAPPSDGQSDGGEAVSGDKKLAGDWSVAMPSRGNIPVTATPLFRSNSDLSLSMSQRLARKFPTRQIHLSLSLSPTLTTSSGPSLDPFASKTLLIMEKKLVEWISTVESS